MELTIEEKLRAIYKVQLIDAKIDQIKRLRGELPLEVADLEDEITGLETRLKKFQDEEAYVKNFITQKEALIKDSIGLKAKYETQLINIKNSREFDAVTKEVEYQGLEVQAATKKINDAKIKLTAKTQDITAIVEGIGTKKTQLTQKQKELDGIVAETKREEDLLQAVSNEAAEGVDTRLLNAYRRIRSNARNGLAVAPIVRDACGGCFNRIPPQRQSDIRSKKKVIVCEYCGRILVDNDIAQIEEAQIA